MHFSFSAARKGRRPTGNGSSMRQALCVRREIPKREGPELSHPSLWMPYGGDACEKQMRPISTPTFPGSAWISAPPFALWRPYGPAAGRPWGGCIPSTPAADGNIGFALSPLVLDGALQVIAAALMEGKFEDHERVRLHLPVGVDHAWLAHLTGGAAWAHATLRKGVSASSRSVLCDVRLLDDQSREIAVLSGCRLVPVDAGVLKTRTELPEERLLYHVRWRPRPNTKTTDAAPAAGEFVFPLQALPERLDALLPELAHAQRFDQYESARADMDALVSLYIMRTLEQLGWQPVPGDRVQCDSLAAQLNVAARHRQLLKRFLDILAEDGVLESAGDGWKVVRAFTGGDPSLRGREILDSGTSGAAELDLIVRCGDRLAEALSGVADPLDLLYRGRCVRFRGQALQRIRHGPGVQWAGQGGRAGSASGLAAGPPVAGA